MIKILKNTTLSDIEIGTFGQTIQASSQITVDSTDYPLLGSADVIAELTPLINAGDIVVNDGSRDLPADLGVFYIDNFNAVRSVDEFLSAVAGSDANLKLDHETATEGWEIRAGRVAFFDKWLLFKSTEEAGSLSVAFRPDGTIRTLDGSAGAPAYGFLNYSNYGMWISGGGELCLSTAGFPRLSLEPDGTLNTGQTPNYETLVTSDDDIPNKKYVDDNQFVRVSSNDTTPGFLNGKLVAGANVTLTEQNDGGNETLEVSADLEIGDLAAAQARRTTNYALTGTYTDVTMDTTDVENDTSVIEHDNTNTARITVKEAGLYDFHYDLYTLNSDGGETIEFRMLINGTTQVPGSFTRTRTSIEEGSREQPGALSKTVSVELTANDYVTFQAKDDGSSNIVIGGVVFKGVRMSGARGQDGVDGQDGAPGPAGSGSTINVYDEGVLVPNSPFSEINIIGAGIHAKDAGGGRVDIVSSNNVLAAGNIGSASNAANQNFQIDLSAAGFEVGDTVRIGNALVRGDLSSDGTEYIDVGFNSTGDPKARLGETGYDDLSIFRTDGSLIDRTYTVVDIGGGTPGLEVYVSPASAVNFSPSGMPNGWWWQFKVDVLVV